MGPNILVVGDSCSGKTTLARALAQRLDLRHIEIDALHWEPNWTSAPNDVLLERVLNATAEPGWAMDGNYGNAIRPHTFATADTIVWIDFPLRITLRRCLSRSWRRYRTRELLWGSNRERFWEHFLPWDRSLFWWILKSHHRRRRTYTAAMTDPQWEGTTFVRLFTPAEVDQFLALASLSTS